MTVIAYDGTTLVADGRCTRLDGSLVGDNHVKLHRTKIKQFGGSCVVALCGATESIGPFLNHLETNGLVPMEHFNFNNPEEEAGFYVRGIAVNRKGEVFEFSIDGGWVQVQAPTATGSGEKIAQHFLLKGCDAVSAILEACKTELSCGGILLSYDWKTDKMTEIRPPVTA